MKHKRVVAALALAFALGIGISFVNLSNDPDTFATESVAEDLAENLPAAAEIEDSVSALDADNISPLADEEETPAPSGEVEADDETSLNTAFASEAVTKITLTQDIALSKALSDAGGLILRRNPTLTPLVIDLNGHNITAEGAYGVHVLRGHLVITGQGTISANTIVFAVKGSANSTDENYVSLEIGQDVTVSAPSGYGITMLNTYTPDSYGAKATINGKVSAMQGLYVNGSIKHTTNPVQVIVGDTAEVHAGKAAVYAAGYAEWNFGAATIEGELGIGAKSGKLTFNNTNITATGVMKDPETGSGSMDITGVVFQIEHHKSYADQIEININGGNYISQHGDVFYEYGLQNNPAENLTQADINITKGNFVAENGRKIFGGDTDEMDIEVSGGKFQGVDAQSFAEQGYLVGDLKVDANGNVVSNKPSTSGGSHNNNTAPTEPETPAEDDKGNNADTDAIIPDTGAILGQGFVSAVSTMAPLVGLAALAIMAYSGKMLRRRQVLNAVEVESEINAELHEIIEPEEPVQDNFVAKPMTKADQDEIYMNIFSINPKKSSKSDNPEN